MGNTPSKQSQSSFEPKVPTEVTQNLKNAVADITETDFALDQKQQASIQQQVAKALKSAEKVASQRIDEAYNKLSKAKLNEKDLNAKDLFAKVHKLQQELDARPKKGVLNKDAVKAREELVECLHTSKEQPLKCYEQFVEFQKVVEGSAK